MKHYDIFNGDADGVCALIQLRRAYPLPAELLTGVKRDIGLLSRVKAEPGDRLTVLDISLDKNRSALLQLLANQVEVFYADHHFAGDIPVHPGLTALIDTQANSCTSLIINAYLGQRFAAWAATGACGDNLLDSAHSAAQALHLSAAQFGQMQQLGVCLNYNAYGETVEDLHVPPAVLYKLLVSYATPFDFLADQAEVFQQLQAAYAEDMQLAQAQRPEYQNARAAVFVLPDEKWARRAGGVWSNALANQFPDRAHAVLQAKRRGGYQVSVRAPLNRKTGADALCRRFPEGGGRQAAAGINHLPEQQLAEFIEQFRLQFA